MDARGAGAKAHWSGRIALLAIAAVAVAVAGCGSQARRPAAAQPPAAGHAIGLVAALGDSITAGSPLWDPDPSTRAQIPSPDPESQFEHWAGPRLGVRFRNCGVFGERTDEIAARFGACVAGARAVILQGGINDIAQGRPVADAAADLLTMVRRARDAHLPTVLVEVLPWNNGYPRAAPLITQLNHRIAAIGRAEHVPVAHFYSALEDPARPGRMRSDLTIDGDHPSVAGYRRLAAVLPAL